MNRFFTLVVIAFCLVFVQPETVADVPGQEITTLTVDAHDVAVDMLFNDVYLTNLTHAGEIGTPSGDQQIFSLEGVRPTSVEFLLYKPVENVRFSNDIEKNLTDYLTQTAPRSPPKVLRC